MTTKRRWVKSMSMVTLLLFTVACSSNGSQSSENPDNTGGNGTDGAGQAALSMNGDTFDPPVTITVARPVGGDVQFRDGETIENNVHTKWAKERLGIDIQYAWTAPSANDSFNTKLRLAISSNEKLPDILQLRDEGPILDTLIESGKFMEVGELFDKHASQTWKDAMNEDPTVWQPFMKDGKKYGVPILDYMYNGDPVLWIREDWMKKFNFDTPQTLADVEKIMDAFTNQDPDGNGQKDTYGLTAGVKNNFNTWMSDLGWVFGAYGTMPNQWNLNESGELEYGSVNEGAKQALETIKSWMDNGYMPQEVLLWDESKGSEIWTAGKAGIIVGPHWMPWWPLEDVKKNVEGAEYRPYPIPAGPDGDIGRHGTNVNNGVILINKDMEHPEVFFHYQNFMFDNYANPQVGGEFQYGMHNGYDYFMEEGASEPATEVPGGAIAVNKYTLTFDGARIPSLSLQTMAKFADPTVKPETPYEIMNTSTAPKQVYEAAKIVLDQKDITMPERFKSSFTSTMKQKWEYLEKLEKDIYAKIIFGKNDSSSFDTFVEEWKKSGGDEVTAEVNAWYDQNGIK
ncbi:extracellular solute-binding protein [Paenibacillus sp. F411]|uniref:extracellular solute-binding protein n=1 Tax=Paenibacillus sp. F411 TaxID=2820239 RepID=UPI001AB004AE|nr:extracellular solute-binding protein [Paenibacillus sp. F411]MBO2942402.1 extracellular solute-binding protein [Paenibacillus sp. F411]